MITTEQEIKILDTFSKGFTFIDRFENQCIYVGNGIFKHIDDEVEINISEIGSFERKLSPVEYKISQEIEEILFDEYELWEEEFGIIWERLLKYTQFFQRPGARSHHHAYEGGLAYHSVEVTLELFKHLELLKLKWQRRASHLSAYIIGMCHDLCKVLCYNADGSYNTAVRGHGDLSVQLFEILFPDIPLTEEEIVCIEHHMGVYMKDWEYCNKFNQLCGQFPNLLYTCVCDIRSSMGIINLHD